MIDFPDPEIEQQLNGFLTMAKLNGWDLYSDKNKGYDRITQAYEWTHFFHIRKNNLRLEITIELTQKYFYSSNGKWWEESEMKYLGNINCDSKHQFPDFLKQLTWVI